MRRGRALTLLLERSRPGVGRAFAAAAIGGLVGAGVVSLSNLTLTASGADGSLGLGAVFLVGIAIMFGCNAYSARQAIALLEDAQHDLRRRVVEHIDRAPLRRVEALGSVPGRLVGDLMTIASGAPQLVGLVGHAAFLTMLTLIIGLTSGQALVLWLVACAAVARIFAPGLRGVQQMQQAHSDRIAQLHMHLEDAIDGFVQLRFDERMRAAVLGDVLESSAALHASRVAIADAIDTTFLRAGACYFVVGLGLVVFAPPDTIGLGPVIGYDMTILFSLALGPLFSLLQTLPLLVRADTAAAGAFDALRTLEGGDSNPPGRGGGRVEHIRMSRASFAYDSFRVGPVDLEIRRGELTLITGGNGSGKTTLIKMLMGLYPHRGRILWDGRAVTRPRLPAYKGLFTTILDDPYLFDELHGLDQPQARVEELLHRFGLAGVVDCDDGQFDRLDLSAGQRMRLAMVVALLEDRPVLIFDEWTAHLDPETTRAYYEQLLPELVAQGRIVIAVSHDDRYFDRADQLIVMQGGQAVVERQTDAAWGPGDQDRA